jgi:glyoxylase-like metal-dependent hydrolase (beta-lactamase superfamily II)
MPDAPPTLPWHGIPTSKTASTCRVFLMQAGGLVLPTDLVLLPGSNKANSSLDGDSSEAEKDTFFVPDFVFLIEHLATGDNYVFDLGMRKDLENSTPAVVQNMLSKFKSTPESPVDILKKHGTTEQQPSFVKAVIFSHLHFDHIGDVGKSGFSKAEIWIGPSTCSSARPGFPADTKSSVFSDDLPRDGSRRIVEFKLPSAMLDDKRKKAIRDATENGNYEAIELREPEGGWFGLGAFEAAFDLLKDGSIYLIDAPGHMAGHQMLLVRVKTGVNGAQDDFVLLAGDCFHHPAMLGNPLLTARPPFSKSSMHGDPETAINTMFRTRRCAQEKNIWVVGAHDFTISRAVSPNTDTVDGLVLLTDWHKRGWKQQLQLQ